MSAAGHNDTSLLHDWSRSFHGLSTEPFSKEAAEVLLAPIDPQDIEIKPGRWNGEGGSCTHASNGTVPCLGASPTWVPSQVLACQPMVRGSQQHSLVMAHADVRRAFLINDHLPASLSITQHKTSLTDMADGRARRAISHPTLSCQKLAPDGLIYLPEIKYRRILNKAFGPGGWGLAPRGATNIGTKIVSREYGLVCLGRLVSIARGEQEYFGPAGVPTATEGCKSNALMRCCKDLGIASELW